MCESRDKSTLPLPSPLGNLFSRKDYGWILPAFFACRLILISHFNWTGIIIMEAGAGIVGFVWVLTAFSSGIVVARSVMKTIRFHGLAWEDYLMIISMVSTYTKTPSNIPSHPLTTTFNSNSFSQSSTESPVHWCTRLTSENTHNNNWHPSTLQNSQNIFISAMLLDSWLPFSVGFRFVCTCYASSARRPHSENAAFTPLSHSNSSSTSPSQSSYSRNVEASKIYGDTAYWLPPHLASATTSSRFWHWSL